MNVSLTSSNSGCFQFVLVFVDIYLQLLHKMTVIANTCCFYSLVECANMEANGTITFCTHSLSATRKNWVFDLFCTLFSNTEANWTITYCFYLYVKLYTLWWLSIYVLMYCTLQIHISIIWNLKKIARFSKTMILLEAATLFVYQLLCDLPFYNKSYVLCVWKKLNFFFIRGWYYYYYFFPISFPLWNYETCS